MDWILPGHLIESHREASELVTIRCSTVLRERYESALQ